MWQFLFELLGMLGHGLHQIPELTCLILSLCMLKIQDTPQDGFFPGCSSTAAAAAATGATTGATPTSVRLHQ